MSRYGIDYYGLALYGPDEYVNFYSNLTASASGYGSISLKWTSPTGSWSKLRLVRNPYGFPVGPFDGTTVFSAWSGEDPTVYEDTDLVQDRYYYYSLFVYEVNQYVWVKAGDSMSVSVKDWGNSAKLWEYLPSIYKQGAISVAGADYENSDLLNFLSIFGFFLDETETVIHRLENRYDLETVNGLLIPLMLKQFGITYEPEIGMQQSRVLLRDAVQLLKEKGSAQGVREYIKSFTGYSLPTKDTTASNPTVDGLVVGHNLMLDYNDSSFEESEGNWVPESGTTIARLGNSSISAVSIASNVITFVIGEHNFKVGDKVVIQEYPLSDLGYHTASLSAVSATSVSYTRSGWSYPDMPLKKVSTGYVGPLPAPYAYITWYVENKMNGILSLFKSTSGSGTLSAKCGSDSPIDNGIPVTGGTEYTFSFYAAANTDSRAVTAKINWYDRLGSLISTSSGAAINDNVSVVVMQLTGVRPYVTATSPALAAYAVPEISIAGVSGSSSDTHFVDGCQFEKSSVPTEFDEARNLHITLKANRINEITNPNFSPSSTNWSYVGGTALTVPVVPEPGVDIWPVIGAEVAANLATLTTSNTHHLEVTEEVSVVGLGAPYDGTHVITAKTADSLSYAVTSVDIPFADEVGFVYHSGSAVELTSSSGAVTVETVALMPIHYPNSSYTFSLYFKTYVGSVVSKASITWYDSAGIEISTVDGDFTTGYDVWNRAYVTGEAPLTAHSASVAFTANTLSGEKVIVFGALFERSAFVLDYFDGHAEGENVSLEDVFWEGGTPNAGRSHFYKNRVSTVYRLKATLPEYLPAGSTFSLYLAQPNT